jgi:hypothetical protein
LKVGVQSPGRAFELGKRVQFPEKPALDQPGERLGQISLHGGRSEGGQLLIDRDRFTELVLLAQVSPQTQERARPDERVFR